MRTVGRIVFPEGTDQPVRSTDWRSFARECGHFSQVGRVWRTEPCLVESPGYAFVVEAGEEVFSFGERSGGRPPDLVDWICVEAVVDWQERAAALAAEIADALGGEFFPVPTRVAEIEGLIDELDGTAVEIRFLDGDVLLAVLQGVDMDDEGALEFFRFRDSEMTDFEEGLYRVRLSNVERITPCLR